MRGFIKIGKVYEVDADTFEGMARQLAEAKEIIKDLGTEESHDWMSTKFSDPKGEKH